MNALESILLLVLGAIAGRFLGRRLCHAWLERKQKAFISHVLHRSRSSAQERLIVSLSTLPDRIDNLAPTLRCMLEQTRPPDEIVIALPDFSVRQQLEYKIPAFLEKMPHVHILRCGHDWGPATKFIPVIQRELERGDKDTLIVVVDDDTIYPRDALETYAHYSRELPDAALCFRGAAMPRSFDYRKTRMIHGKWLREPKRVALITGYGSYLIKPEFFDATLWSYDGAPSEAFYMDDIWISGCLDRRGVKKYVVPYSLRLRSVKEQSRTMTLADVPNGRRSCNNETIAYFRAGWNVFPIPSESFFSWWRLFR